MTTADSHPYPAADLGDDAGRRQANAHRELAARLANVAAGHFPEPDGSVTILAQPSDRDAGVISFTGCAVVFADTDPAWIAAQLPEGDLSAPLSASFLAALGERLSRQTHSVDILTCAPAAAGAPAVDVELTELTSIAGTPHPRVARAQRHRDHVRVWQTAGGVLIVGRGVAGRWETAIEVEPDHRGRGLGTRLAAAARHLVPAGATLWAQIAAANAASVRAFLAAGFRPVGAEALLDTDQEG